MNVLYGGIQYTVLAAHRNTNMIELRRNDRSIEVNPLLAGARLVVDPRNRRYLEEEYGIQFSDPFESDPVIDTTE